jgi:hypothetical protein
MIKVRPTDRVISKQIEVPNSAWLDVGLSLLDTNGGATASGGFIILRLW